MRSLCAIFILSAVAASAGAAPAFQVEIAINEPSVKTDFYKKMGEFFVDTHVTNISDSTQSITVWTQPGWSWVSDTPSITPGTEALKNVPSFVTLKPGQDYKSGAEMFADLHAKRPVTFRLGFVPNTKLPASGIPGREKDKDIIWSNPVTLTQ